MGAQTRNEQKLVYGWERREGGLGPMPEVHDVERRGRVLALARSSRLGAFDVLGVAEQRSRRIEFMKLAQCGRDDIELLVLPRKVVDGFASRLIDGRLA